MIDFPVLSEEEVAGDMEMNMEMEEEPEYLSAIIRDEDAGEFELWGVFQEGCRCADCFVSFEQ